MTTRSDSDSRGIDIQKLLLCIAVMVIALLVRVPAVYLSNVSREYKDVFTDDSGLPYFTDMDSYYHVRLVNTVLNTGKLEDTVSPEGVPWDTHSFYPEGRSAVYQPGIVYLTIFLWRVFNLSVPVDIATVEYYLAGFMAMITALAAFITGCRINGKMCGFVAGILTGCSPMFVMRATFGRFDTDIFVLLMNDLLILTLTEMLREKNLRNKVLFAAAFVLISIVYAMCWAPQFSTLFAGLTLFGGLICSAIECWRKHNELKPGERVRALFTDRGIGLVFATGIMTLLIIGISMGFSVVRDIFMALSFKTTQGVSEGVLPNMFESIAELQRPDFFPKGFVNWFKGAVPSSVPTVINGIGGAFTAVAAILGLLILGLHSFGKLKVRREEIPDGNDSFIYFVVLGIWTIAGLYLTYTGMRFIEMMTVPIGLLAGIFLGWLYRMLKSDDIKRRIAGIMLSLIAVCFVTVPDLTGALVSVNIPSVTDASANAMKWIKDNAEDPEAVIESWWDMGYYYESESDHPCLWDGGTQDPARAIMVSRALTETDMGMSWHILNMLACSGNEAIDILMDHVDPKNAFDILWDVLPMDSQSTCKMLCDKCNMDISDAQTVEKLIHPENPKEAYLVLTFTMIKQTDIYEYYSQWDFTGTQIPPFASEEPLDQSKQEQLEKARNGETMWRLFLNMEDNPYFIPEYEYYDGIEGVRIWKLTSGI